MKRLIPAIAALTASLALAQTTDISSYRFDFSRLFPTPEAEKADRHSLEKTLGALEELRGKVGSSSQNLARALELRDLARTQFFRHYIYLNLRDSVDTSNASWQSEAESLDDEVKERTAFLDDELQGLSDDLLTRLERERPELARYRFAIESLRRYRDHHLSAAEEKVFIATAPLGRDWQWDLHELLVARTDFGTVNVGGKPLDVLRDRLAIAAAPDRSAREEGFRKRYAGFAAQRDLYAFVLRSLAASRNALAKVHRFEDDAACRYFARYWTKSDVTSLLERVAERAEVYKGYQRLRAEHIRRTMRYEEVNAWDMEARPSDVLVPWFGIDEARDILLAATGPLGTDYHGELAGLLDPASGRMDIVPGPHRRSGGFSQGYVGTDSLFFSGGFTGSYNDVRVLMHESTHAVQRQLMNAHHVLPSYFDGPHYLAEAYAIFNELLLADYLYAREKDPLRRVFYAEQFLDGKGMAAFVVAPEAELEQAVYDGVTRGTIRNADDLDALTKRVYGRYSIWPARHDELKSQWAIVPLMYEDPFYDVNYVYGALIGLRLYAMYAKDPVAFAPRYVAALREGYDAPPATLLLRNFGIDLKGPGLVGDAVTILEARVDALARDYGIDVRPQKR